MKKAKRNLIVFTGLLSVLTGTSLFLLVMAPNPLRPSVSMLAVDSPSGVAPGKWQYIYLHHSKNQTTAGDHFVVGPTGEVRATDRWAKQLPPGAPPGAKEIYPSCVSIAFEADFDRKSPTSEQLAAARGLVVELEATLSVGSDKILMLEQKSSAVGVGRSFPLEAFRKSCQP